MENERYFTPEMRVNIYKLAYKYYLESIEDNINRGICLALRNSIEQLIRDDKIFDLYLDYKINGMIPDFIDPYSSLTEYPELLECKPSHMYDYNFWWDIDDTTSRINVFKKIIGE